VEAPVMNHVRPLPAETGAEVERAVISIGRA
jgi:hypothetical protein